MLMRSALVLFDSRRYWDPEDAVRSSCFCGVSSGAMTLGLLNYEERLCVGDRGLTTGCIPSAKTVWAPIVIDSLNDRCDKFEIHFNTNITKFESSQQISSQEYIPLHVLNIFGVSNE